MKLPLSATTKPAQNQVYQFLPQTTLTFTYMIIIAFYLVFLCLTLNLCTLLIIHKFNLQAAWLPSFPALFFIALNNHMVLVDDYLYFLSSSFQFSLSRISSDLLHILNLLIVSAFFLEYFLFPFLLFKSAHFLMSLQSSSFSTKPSIQHSVMLSSMSLVFFHI